MLKWAFDEFVKEYEKDFAIYILLKSISGILVFLPPVFIGKSIDDALERDFFGIMVDIVSILFVLIINALVSIGESKKEVKINLEITCDVRLKLINKYIRMEQFCVDSFTRGEMLSRLDDADNVAQLFIDLSTFIFVEFVSLFFALGVMVYISPVLSIICLFNIPAIFFIQRMYGKRIKKLELEVKKSGDDYTSILYEIIDSLKNIKVANLQQIFFERLKTKLKHNIVLNKHKSNLSIYVGFFNVIINGIFQLVLLMVGCFFIVTGIISVGNYFTFNSYVSKFNYALQSFSQIHLKKQMYYVTIKRIKDLLSEEMERTGANTIENILFDTMHLKNIRFKYNEQSTFELKVSDIFFNINEITAIVGENGIGKSTLFDLLVGVYPFEGSIYLDDIDINEISLYLRRKIICYIQQDPFFFSGTIRENLILDNKDMPDKALEEACEQVGMNEYIDNLELKYNTKIQENGSDFSGGQLQRLALARAILSDSKVILLDEITSDIDEHGKLELYEAMKNMKRNRIIVVVSHDPSIKEIADKIIYI